MSIQFLCPGCGQPIEVDDEFANRLVGCPFCQTTAEAPAQSKLPAPVDSADAAMSDTGAPGTPPFGPAAAPAYVAAGPQRSTAAARLCTVALLCGIGLWTTMFIATLVILRQPEVRSAVLEIQAGDRDSKTLEPLIAKAGEEITKSNPGGALLVMAAVVLFAITGLVTSVLGLMWSPQRRWQAVVGLVMCGSCSLVQGLSMVGAGASGS